jgi:hypothetical protein
MRKRNFTWFFWWMFIASCVPYKPFQLSPVSNPEFIPNTLFINYKDSSAHKFVALREKYKLDTVFHGEKDEFKRILLLRHWLKKNVPVTPDGEVRHEGEPTAENILDQALKGNGYHCAYFMVVHTELMNACGYVARVINADEGELNLPHQIAHHGTNEVWSNTYHKWFFSDAMFDCHFEKNGIPLSALEIRDEYLKNKAADVTMMYGPDRKPIDIYPDKNNRTTAIFTRVFTWIAWFRQSDTYSNWNNGISYMIMYDDDYFRTHKWIRVDGKPHWTYGTRYLILTKNRNELYWTPNTITSEVNIHEKKATIKLHSVTPFFKTYQMKKVPGGEWENIPGKLEVSLENDSNELVFRTVNFANVTGEEHKIIIKR